jgi:hypothetical protein
MPATESQRTRFRNAVGDTDGTKFTDDQIDDIFDMAAEDYPSGSNKTVLAAAVVSGLESLLAQAAQHVSIQQNESQEDLSDMTKNYKMALDYWSKKLNDSVKDDATTTAASSGLLAGWKPMRSQTEKRKREYPDA